MKKIKVTVKSKKINITSEYIKLDDLLKLAGAVLSGGEAKHAVQNGEVFLDGEVCTMRGKKIRDGQTVSYKNQMYEVVYEGQPAES